jgi:hypothetical protein
MQQRNPWDNDAVVPAGGGMVITKAADPGRQYAEPKAAAELQSLQLRNAQMAREAAQQDSPIDPATVSFMAQQVLAGGQMPALGMGKQAAAARQAVMAEVARQAGARGLNGADLATQVAHYKAGSKQIANLENMAGTIGVNEQTAMANGQQYIDRSAELPGQTSIAPLNAISNWVQRRFGGETISKADAAYGTFTNEYAKVVAGSPSGAGTLSDSARHEAQETMNGNGSFSQKQAAFDQMKADMANRMAAIHNGITNAYKGLTQQPGYQVPADTAGLVMQAAQGHQGIGGPSDGMGGGTPPSGDSGPSGDSPAPNMPIGSGPGGLVPDPDRQKVVDQLSTMLSSGRPDAEVMAFAKSAGLDPVSSGLADNLKYRQQNHGYGNFGPNVAPAMKPRLQPAFSLTGGTSPLGTFAMNAASALTGNTLDNMTADPALARAGLAGANAANPTAGLLGDITGGGLAAAGAELGAGALAGRAGIAAASPWITRSADALYGGISGAGAADDSSRIAGGLFGAAVGAGGGEFGRRVLGPAAASLGQRALGMFGRGSTASAPALTGAESMLLGVANKSGVPGIQSQLSEAARLGVPMSLADTTAPMTSLAGAVVRRSPDASQIAQDVMLPRSRGQIDRFGQAVRRDLGDVTNVPQASADLMQQARTAAAPLYPPAYAAPGASSVQLDDIINRPLSMKPGIARAKTIAEEEGRDPTSLGFDLTSDGEVTLGRVPSFQTLDYVKRGLDDILEPHRNQITGKLDLNEATRAINATKNTLLGRVDAVNPLYADARRAYAGPAAAKDALARGYDSMGLDPDLLGQQVAAQTPEHLAQMQLGQRGAMMQQANGYRLNSNPFDGVLGTPAAGQRIAAVQQNPAGLSNLLRQRDVEGQVARSTNQVLGNSMTAQRQIADDAFAGGALPAAAIDGATMLAGGVPLASASRALGTGALRDLGRLGLGKRAVAKADALAPLLFKADPTASGSILTDLLAKDAARRAYLNNSSGRRIGGMFGAGLGLLPFSGQ